jgi:hypothetical protein
LKRHRELTKDLKENPTLALEMNQSIFDATWLELVTHMDIFGVPRKTIGKVLRPLFAKFKLRKETVNEIQAYIDKPKEGPEVKISIMGDSSAEKNTYYLRTKDG